MANGLLDNLLSYWKLEEVPTHPDSSVNSNTLGIIAGSTFPTTTGKKDLAANQGTDNANRRGNAAPSVYHFGNEAFSMNLWINSTSAGWADGTSKALMGVWDNDGANNERNWAVSYLASTDDLRFHISSDGIEQINVLAGQGTPTADTWHMLSCGYDLSNIWIQYNGGTRVETAHTTGAFAASTAPFTFGWAAFAATIRMGAIKYDEVAIWNKSISTSDVSTLYASGAGFFFDSFDSASPPAAAAPASNTHILRQRIIKNRGYK